MMPTFSLIALVLSLTGQGLTFSAPNTWSFTGTVIEVRQVFVMGLPSQIALVQSTNFEAWVIQRMASQSNELPEIVLGPAVQAPNVLVGVGDLVRVSISGPHVSDNGIDWDRCQPIYSNYCRQGGLYDTGPIATDWNVPLSPSNEFIHWGHANPSTEYPLFWNTEKLFIDDDKISGSPRPHRVPGTSNPRQPACLALRKGNNRACAEIAAGDATRLLLLADSPVKRCARDLHPGRNISVAERLASRTRRVRVPPYIDGNFLAGDTDPGLYLFSE